MYIARVLHYDRCLVSPNVEDSFDRLDVFEWITIYYDKSESVKTSVDVSLVKYETNGP